MEPPMKTPMSTRTTCLMVSSWITLGLLLTGCQPQDDTLGSQGCEQAGKTYQVGEAVVLSACTSCVCQKDGVVGMCASLCGPDGGGTPDATVMCTQNGRKYQIGETIALGACTSCVCQ